MRSRATPQLKSLADQPSYDGDGDRASLRTAFMTQNDLTNGRLMCGAGIAPWCPAEFVIFSICPLRRLQTFRANGRSPTARNSVTRDAIAASMLVLVLLRQSQRACRSRERGPLWRPGKSLSLSLCSY